MNYSEVFGYIKKMSFLQGGCPSLKNVKKSDSWFSFGKERITIFRTTSFWFHFFCFDKKYLDGKQRSGERLDMAYRTVAWLKGLFMVLVPKPPLRSHDWDP